MICSDPDDTSGSSVDITRHNQANDGVIGMQQNNERGQTHTHRERERGEGKIEGGRKERKKEKGREPCLIMHVDVVLWFDSWLLHRETD